MVCLSPEAVPALGVRSVEETAVLLSSSTSAVRRMLDRGELTPVLIGRRKRVDVASIAKYLESRRQAAAGSGT